jgi:16S rRNA (cytidine1402-2'-O)-methyltransferase
MLYVCATPIGNLADISLRALETLRNADIILCEDTRVSQHLLHHYQISGKKLVSFHQHNEAAMLEQVIAWLEAELVVVQLSDAGTPAISDPGAKLCAAALALGYTVSPIPGPTAMTTLLSVAGIEGSVLFVGFLQRKSAARHKQLLEWQNTNLTVCLYESPKRIVLCLTAIQTALGAQRLIVLGRELTKKFETIKKATVADMLTWIMADHNQQKGEFVLLILAAPAIIPSTELSPLAMQALELLSAELSTKSTVAIVHKLLTINKQLLYNYLIQRS